MDASGDQYLRYEQHRQQNLQAALDREREDILSGLKRPSSYEYTDLNEIESSSPSVKDGLDPAKQAKWRREYLHLIYKAGVALKVPPWGCATAALMCHRFFMRKSMKRNDRFVIATACLHLAAKIQEAPKPIKEVVRACAAIRHAKNPAILKRLDDPAYVEEAKEQILMAERAVLYTLGFDLNIQHPHNCVLKYFSDLDVMTGGAPSGKLETKYKELLQNAWNFLNDSFRTTLCLQFPAEKLAAAAIYLANDLNKQQFGRGLEDVILEKTGDPKQTFFSYFSITPREVQIISDQILDLYEQIKRPNSEVKSEAGVESINGASASVNGQPSSQRSSTPMTAMQPPAAGPRYAQPSPASTPATPATPGQQGMPPATPLPPGTEPWGQKRKLESGAELSAGKAVKTEGGPVKAEG